MSFDIRHVTLQEHYGFSKSLYRERDTTPVYPAPSGMTQYIGEEVYTKTLYVPIGAFVEDKMVGSVLSRNISDTTLYFSGQWIEPNYRSLGISKAMILWFRDFWPPQFDTALGYFISSSFIRRATTTYPRAYEYPGHCWFHIKSGSFPHEKTIMGYTKF